MYWKVNEGKKEPDAQARESQPLLARRARQNLSRQRHALIRQFFQNGPGFGFLAVDEKGPVAAIGQGGAQGRGFQIYGAVQAQELALADFLGGPSGFLGVGE